MSMSKVQACISCISGSLIGHLSLQGEYLSSFGVIMILFLTLFQTETIRRLKDRI